MLHLITDMFFVAVGGMTIWVLATTMVGGWSRIAEVLDGGSVKWSEARQEFVPSPRHNRRTVSRDAWTRHRTTMIRAA